MEVHEPPGTKRFVTRLTLTMSVSAKIHGAAARNTELLRALHETDSAIPDLEAHKRYIADLEREAAACGKKFDELGRKRVAEGKEHAAYRGSVMRRFAYKVGGQKDKFEARAAKEEREYFDALQEEHKAGVMKQNVDAMLAEAGRAGEELEGKVAAHQAAQAELDGLYESIFAGPTPGLSEEDERERERDAAVQAYREAQSRVEAEAQAVKILSQAQKRFNGALVSMEQALSASRMDMFGGGVMADMMERNALCQAENQISQARMMVTQAQRSSPLVRDLPTVTIAQGHLMGDVFFDNIFSDAMFHDKIHQSAAEVQRCASALGADLNAARKRCKDLSQGVVQKSAAVQEARMRLQKAREAAFRGITGQAGPEATAVDVPPPAYSAGAEPEVSWWET